MAPGTAPINGPKYGIMLVIPTIRLMSSEYLSPTIFINIKHNIPIMAYCPMAQAGRLRRDMNNNHVLNKIANNHGLSIIELLLCFVLQKEQIIAIPRTGNPEHAFRNSKVKDIILSKEELKMMDKEFPAPNRKVYLDIV